MALVVTPRVADNGVSEEALAPILEYLSYRIDHPEQYDPNEAFAQISSLEQVSFGSAYRIHGMTVTELLRFADGEGGDPLAASRFTGYGIPIYVDGELRATMVSSANLNPFGGIKFTDLGPFYLGSYNNAGPWERDLTDLAMQYPISPTGGVTLLFVRVDAAPFVIIGAADQAPRYATEAEFLARSQHWHSPGEVAELIRAAVAADRDHFEADAANEKERANAE